MGIRERILARRDLDAIRAARDIDVLAAKLNEESQPVLVPARINAASILSNNVHHEVIIAFLQSAAAGEDVAVRAQELISDDGVEVLEEGFDPPLVDRYQVNDAMFNPDGSEKQ